MAAYGDAGIPVLMPIATSPHARQPLRKAGVPQAWRLPPADVPYQAAAVAHVVTNRLQAQRCLVVRDLSPDADEYSTPFNEAVIRNLTPHCHLLERADVSTSDPKSILAVGPQITGNNIDVVVFIGYGTTANRLLQVIRDSCQVAEYQPPAVVLTDGAKVEDLNVEGIAVHLTFPIAPLDKIACSGLDAEVLKREVANIASQSYELFGYDGMLMLAKATEKCSERGLSRECIRDELRKITSFTGACRERPYVFDSAGDNTLGYYYLFSNVQPEGAPTSLSFTEELDPKAFLPSSVAAN
jgi:ABC-type branched-subunit amino acid transport system substrate-binding protein